MLAHPTFMRWIVSSLVVAMTACTGTIDSPGPGGNPEAPDAGDRGGGGSGGSGGGVVDAGVANAMFPCKNLVTAGIGSGQHNAGQDCMNGCHNHGFTLAGTLYNAGGTALTGATITVKDANGATFDMVAQQNGNFYTKQAISFPVTVYASSCPTSTPMSSAVAAGSGGCNKSGCHATGAQGRIHL